MVLEVLKKTKQYGMEMFDELQSGQADAVIFSKKLVLLNQMIGKLEKVVPEKIYIEYKEFFKLLAELCSKCENVDVLINNVDNIAGSLDVYVECMGDLINKYSRFLRFECEVNSEDKSVLSFLKKIELYNASGETLLQIAPARFIEHWIYGNCHGLIYDAVDGDIGNVERKGYDYIICSLTLEEVSDNTLFKKLSELVKDEGMVIFWNWGRKDDKVIGNIEKLGFSICIWEEELYILTKRGNNWEKVISDKKIYRLGVEKSMPLVTVLLPSYNHEQYIEEAIESVLNQTYKNIQFIIADDGSKDGTEQKILKYKDKVDEIYIYKENTKGNMTRSLVAKAKGKYIAMMHSDDIWELDKLERQVAYMENHSECGACFTGAGIVGENGDKLKREIFVQMNMKKEKWIRRFYEGGNCLAHPSVLIKRELYVELWDKYFGHYFWQLPDYCSWIHLLMENEIHVIERELLYFRMHESGENKNTSAATQENSARTQVEETYIWYDAIKNMDNITFSKIFGDLFEKNDPSNEKEIMCEKMFLLLNPRFQYCKQAGIFYMFDIVQIPGMMEYLEKEYNWNVDMAKKITGDFLFGK